MRPSAECRRQSTVPSCQSAWAPAERVQRLRLRVSILSHCELQTHDPFWGSCVRISPPTLTIRLIGLPVRTFFLLPSSNLQTYFHLSKPTSILHVFRLESRSGRVTDPVEGVEVRKILSIYLPGRCSSMATEGGTVRERTREGDSARERH